MTATRKPMTRIKAATIHLAVSSSIILTSLVAACIAWYPYGLWPWAVPNNPTLLLLAVVFVIGPLLTLLVYRPGKRTLRSDLIVVALIQAVFFSYAMVMLGRARPVFLVGNGAEFRMVRAHEVDREDLARAMSTGHPGLSLSGPQVVGIRYSDDLLVRVLGGDRSAELSQHTDLATVTDSFRRQARPIAALSDHPVEAAKAREALRALKRTDADTRWVPMVSQGKSGVLLVDADTATPLKLLATLPGE